MRKRVFKTFAATLLITSLAASAVFADDDVTTLKNQKSQAESTLDDLKNQLALAYEGNTDKIDENISKTKSIDTILKNAQSVFNEWSKLPDEERTGEAFINNVDLDYFKLLDTFTIARSRRHIEKVWFKTSTWI